MFIPDAISPRDLFRVWYASQAVENRKIALKEFERFVIQAELLAKLEGTLHSTANCFGVTCFNPLT